MSNKDLIPKKIIDKNGKSTTVWVSPEKDAPTASASSTDAARNPLSIGGSSQQKLTIDDGKPLNKAESKVLEDLYLDKDGSVSASITVGDGEDDEDAADADEVSWALEQHGIAFEDVDWDDEDMVVTIPSSVADPDTVIRAAKEVGELVGYAREDSINTGRIIRELKAREPESSSPKSPKSQPLSPMG